MNYLKLFEEIQHPGITGKKVDSWINIKIDKDLPLRISRYAKALDVYVDSDDLEKKLEILSDPDLLGKYGVQCKLSIIILLQYLKEIRSNFEDSAAGFLFEDFIAGLLHSKRYGGREGYDFIDSYGKTCQIKFYSENTTKIQIRKDLCDYYILGLKNGSRTGAKVWIIYSDDEKIDEYLVPTVVMKYGKPKDVRIIDISLLEDSIEPYYLSFGNLDSVIEKLSDELKDFIKVLYDNISELNYNIETIITGVDKNQKVIGVNNLEKYYKYSEQNIENIQDQILFVKNEISGLIKRYK